MIEVFDNPEAVETLTLRGKIKEVANSANIAAVFMYDTRLDTDGGAWRKKCAGLSWYDETLNSATRGNRKEFPSRALIVADNSGGVTFYDADDPVLPMWMNIATGVVGGSITSISALNGRVWIGTNLGTIYSRFVKINFIEDEFIVDLQNYTTGGGRGYEENVEGRNANSFYDRPDKLPTLVDGDINAIAQHVYAGANLDRLGLPIPTVAVATDGGVSVIHPSGDVYDSSSTTAKKTINFNNVGQILAAFYNATESAIQIYDYVDTFADGFGQQSLAEKVHASASVFKCNFLGSNPLISILSGRIAVGTDEGVTLYNYNRGDIEESAVAYITSKYNTGFMHGDIRGAWGLDKDHAATIVGSDLVTNGAFATDLTGWTLSASTPPTWDAGGYMQFNSDGVTFSEADQSITTVAGVTYVLEFNFVANAQNLIVRVGTTQGGTEIKSVTKSTLGIHFVTFKATGTTTWIGFRDGGSVTHQQIDDVSVRVAIPDRSVKGNGLGVYGTINVGAVSTGADLRALSGFSASNYASQPNNSDLDFGTGDFHITTWLNTSDAAAQDLLSRSDSTSEAGDWVLHLSSAEQLQFYRYDGASFVKLLEYATALSVGEWYRVDVVKFNGNIYLYVNGEMMNSAANTDSFTPAGGSVFTIGLRLGGTNYATGSTLTLPRISATAPTPDQIKDMYELERPLFFENALCTLQADQVNDVSYDSVTDVLEVAEEATAGSSRIKGLEVVEVVKSDEDFGLAASKELDGITAVNGFRAAYTDGGAGINVPARDASSDLDIGLDGNGQKQIEFDAVTTDNTATVIGKIPIDENEFVAVDAMVRGAGYNDGSIYATYHIVGTFTRDIGGNVTLRGTVQDQHTAVESTGSYNAELVVDTTAQTVDVRVTGGASDRIQWHVDAQVNWKDDHHY